VLTAAHRAWSITMPMIMVAMVVWVILLTL
jgi:hypothetical protein